jgi:multidrug efflux pump subunit AcrB
MEVITPVTTAVLTTMAAFLPLMLLPGILGKFMLVIPMVVTAALAISLVEAFWLLPAHVIAMNVSFNKRSRLHMLRERLQRSLRIRYIKTLIAAMRRPVLALSILVVLFSGAISMVYFERIKFDFFASDPIRLFYVNVQMPAGTELGLTLDKVLEVESRVLAHIEQGESRSVVSYAGQLLTQTEPLFGDQYGQILVSLKPKTSTNRSVDEMIVMISMKSLPQPTN